MDVWQATNCADMGTHVKSNLFVFQSSLKWCTKEVNFRFPTFPNGTIYDSYNENIHLYKVLGIEASDLVLDLADNEKTYDNKRFLLTTKILNYKILKKFSLQFRPIELNVMMNSKGEGIYLYDLNQPEKSEIRTNAAFLISYRYKIHSILAVLHKIGIKSIIGLIIIKLFKKK